MTAPHALFESAAPPLVGQRSLNAGALIGAAALIGFGLILLIAANWDDFGRFGRFGLVVAVILAGGLGAVLVPTLKVPLLLLGFAATGGMLALIGQTYQTGADVWQLFAVWAALTLPWALAARSDPIWTPWAVVALTAIGLWEQTHAGWSWQIASFPRGVLIAAWAMALAIPAALAPFSRVQRWTGSTPWAFRVSLVMALMLIGQQTIAAELSSPAAVDIALLGLIVHAGLIVTLIRLAPRDIAMMSATALAIDAVLISGFARLIMPRNGIDVSSFVLIGLVAAVVIACSVVALMRVVQTGGEPAALDHAAETSTGSARVQLDGARPWPVILLSGIGAVMAAIPFIVALATLFGSALEKGPAAYVVAVAIVPVALIQLRIARGLFMEQLATIGLAVGTSLAAFALFRDLRPSLAGLMLAALAVSMALWLGRAWIGALLGAMAAACLAVSFEFLMPLEMSSLQPVSFGVAWSLLVVMWAGALQAIARHRQWLEPDRGACGLDAILSGWIVVALLGLSVGSGPTFLLSSVYGGGGMHSPGSGSLSTLLAVSRVLSLLMAVGACASLINMVPTLRTPLGYAIAIALIGLSAAMPALGPVALVLALSLVGGRRVIAIAAAVAAVWILGSFYYNLALTLTEKAAILASAGAMLGAVALVSGARIGFEALPGTPGAPTFSFDVFPLGVVRGLAALGLVLVGGVSVQAIYDKEALIRNGRPVFVELVPVDPRSLMQGDYMALRFALPEAAVRHQPRTGMRPQGIGMLDANGVARLTRIGDATTELRPGEIRIEMLHKNGRWIVVTDAWFFKEGTARKWEAARFGELRVLPDGRALLVGLADKDRVAIR